MWLLHLLGLSAAPVQAPVLVLHTDSNGNTVGVMEQVRNDASAGISNALSGLGGASDKGAIGQITRRSKLPIDQLDTLFELNGFARTVVTILPDHACRKGWLITQENSDDPTDPFSDLNDALHVPAVTQDVLEKARLHGGAFLWLLTASRDQEAPMAPDEVVHRIMVVERTEANPIEYDGNADSERYMLPVMYSIAPQTPAVGNTLIPRVHHSRLIYVDGNTVSRKTRLSQNGYGDSVLEACWDQIRHVSEHGSAGAVLGQEQHVNVLKMANLAAMSMGDAAGALVERIRALSAGKSLLNMIVLGAGEEYQVHPANASGFAEIGRAAKEDLSATSRIPMPLMFGVSPGGLNSDGKSWQTAWNESVAAYQTKKVRPVLLQVYRALAPQVGLAAEGWDIAFKPLDQPTALDQAQIELYQAQTDHVKIDDSVLDSNEVRKHRHGGAVYGSTPIVGMKGDLEAPLTPDSTVLPETP